MIMDGGRPGVGPRNLSAHAALLVDQVDNDPGKFDLPTGPGAWSGASLDNPREYLAGFPFLSVEPRGIFALLERMDDSLELARLVDQVFSAGLHFKGLNYKNLAGLLHDLPPLKLRFPRLLIAETVAPFTAARRALYQGELFANPREASYDFTFRLDSRITFAQGVKPPTADEAPRNIDEFVAAMWQKGIRYGLDLEAVEKGLNVPRNQYLRLKFAQALDPTPGVNARVEPLINLNKDLRPVESAEGEVDLRRYLCVFPQARENQVILRKHEAQPGREGRTVFGDPVPTTTGKDLNLAKLAGKGTHIDVVGTRECLLADKAGFVSVNPRSGAVSVTDEVINHTPVGIHTGSLTIEAERCVQFGGVGHGYSLEANSLELRSGSLEGAVVSRAGDVLVEAPVNGGRVTALEGNVTVKAPVRSGSVLRAYHGRLVLDQAENCTLVAREVEVRRAANATIIAEQVKAAECLGCSVFAFSIQIALARSAARRGQQGELSAVGNTLVVPIVEPPKRPMVIIRRTIERRMYQLPELEAQIDRIGGDPHVQAYLRALKGYQFAKNEEEAGRQMDIMQPMEKKVLPLVERWRGMQREQKRLLDLKASLEEDLRTWQEKTKAIEEDLQGMMKCVVQVIEGELVTLKICRDQRLLSRFDEVAEMDPERRAQFEDLCRHLLNEITAGQIKELILPLKESFSASYRDLMRLLARSPDRASEPLAVATTEQRRPEDRRRENRLVLMERADLLAWLGDPDRPPPPGRMLLTLRVDDLLEGYLGDLSGLGLGIFLDRLQRYEPAFAKGDKVLLQVALGSASLTTEMVVTFVQETTRLVRVGGYLVNLPPSLQASLYRVKNALEARLRA